MKKILLSIVAIITAATLLGVTACSSVSDDYENPGDKLGGGQVVTGTANSYDSSAISDRVESADTTVIGNGDVVTYDKETCTAVNLSSLSGDYLVIQSGDYVFTGSTTYSIILSTKGIDVHLFFENATFDSIFSDGKPSSTVITLTGEIPRRDLPPTKTMTPKARCT